MGVLSSVSPMGFVYVQVHVRVGAYMCVSREARG